MIIEDAYSVTLTGAELETRRNLALDPAATKYISGNARLGWRAVRWFGAAPAAGTYTLVTGTGPLPGVNTYARKTWTVAPAALGGSGDTGFEHVTGSAAAGYPVTPGDVYVISSYLRSSVRRRIGIGVYQWDGAGVAMARIYAPRVTALPGVWTRISHVYQVPAGVATMALVSDSHAEAVDGNAVWTVGATLDGTALLVEKFPDLASAIVADYFSGATTDTTDYRYDWVAAATDSPSTQTRLRHPLSHKGGPLTLDDAWAPRVQGSVEVAIPDTGTLELLDTREQLRLTVACSASYSAGSPTARTFDLAVRGRAVDHEAGTVSIDVASDEALLMDDVWIDDEPNLDGLDHQHSLRSLINAVILSRIGAALQPGSADSTFYVLENATNQIVNPTFEANANAVTAGGNCTFVRVTTQAYLGTGSLQIANSAVGLFAVALDTSASVGTRPVRAGDPFTFQWRTKANSVLDVWAAVRFFDASNVQVGADVAGVHVATTTTGWQLVTVAGTVPATATKALPLVFGQATSGGHLVWVDAASLSESPDYFDGSTPDTLDYAYQWTSVTDGSTSTRTALVDRSPDLLDWEPGDSAWSFVQPLVQAAGLRLFCDEQRRWFLVDPSYIAPGYLQLSVPYNLGSAVDRMSRDDPEWFDAAILIYRWLDYMAVRQERIDYYAAPGHTKTRTFVIERPYPGPGAAEYFVTRALGRGRTMRGLETLARFDTEPVQPLVVTLPSTPIQTGVVAAVTFDTSTGRMSVDSRGLTDTPANAVVFLPGTIDSLPGTIDSLLA